LKNGPYNLVVAPKDYPGMRYRGRYAYEHTVVWWQHHGFVPNKGLEIHHLNNNHRDNKINNLCLVTSAEHRKIHGKQRHEKAKKLLVCRVCEKDFFITKSAYRSRLKKNVSGNMSCSRLCQYKSMVGGTRAGSRERTVNASRNAVVGSNPTPPETL
jgi:hypothetical protein